MSNCIGMMEWYLSEMLCITDRGRPDEELCQAEELRSWIRQKWHEDSIDKRTMMKKRPRAPVRRHLVPQHSETGRAWLACA
jgi:hypothetical protein